jgi:hypothetical protein
VRIFIYTYISFEILSFFFSQYQQKIETLHEILRTLKEVEEAERKDKERERMKRRKEESEKDDLKARLNVVESQNNKEV